MSSERRKRPDLERIAPIRDFSRIFGPPQAPPGAPRQGPGAEGVSRGVALGYQVIDEYMRQGEELARGMSMSMPASGPGVPRFAPGELQPGAARLLQTAADFAASLMDLMQGAAVRSERPRAERPAGVPGFDINPAPVPPPPRPEPAGGAERPMASAAPAAPEPSWRAPVTLRLVSRKELEVSVDINSHGSGSLHAHDLRALDPSLPRIEGIAVEHKAGTVTSGPDGWVVRLRVPDEQPAGIYSGIIVDGDTNLPRGTLSVKVLA